MRLVLAALLAAAPLAAHADTRVWTPGRFDRIETAGSWRVIVTTGLVARVVAEGDARDLERLRVEVKDGALEVGSVTGLNWNEWRARGPVTVRVTAPPLRAAAVAGSGDLTLDRVAGRRFAGEVAGSGNLSIGEVAATEVALSVAGSGNVTARGRADKLSVDIAGSGNADVPGLRARDLAADIAGSGTVVAFATGAAAISIAGSGDVTVRGGARCSVSRVGSGRADCRA